MNTCIASCTELQVQKISTRWVPGTPSRTQITTGRNERIKTLINLGGLFRVPGSLERFSGGQTQDIHGPFSKQQHLMMSVALRISWERRKIKEDFFINKGLEERSEG